MPFCHGLPGSMKAVSIRAVIQCSGSSRSDRRVELVGADLIVMPTAGRAGVFEVLRGGTTERVLRQARCPLLAVPASSGT